MAQSSEFLKWYASIPRELQKIPIASIPEPEEKTQETDIVVGVANFEMRKLYHLATIYLGLNSLAVQKAEHAAISEYLIKSESILNMFDMLIRYHYPEIPLTARITVCKNWEIVWWQDENFELMNDPSLTNDFSSNQDEKPVTIH